MALTGWSATNYLKVDTPIWPGQMPFIYSMWGWKPAGARTGFFVALGQDGLDNHRRSLVHIENPGETWAQTRDTVNQNAITVGGPDGAWYHVAGAWVSSTVMEVWVNGGNKVMQAATNAPGPPNATFIGARPDLGFPWVTEGALAGFSAWDADGMVEQERDDLVSALAAGTNPLTLNQETETLVGYAGLEDTNDLGPFSMQGSLTQFGSHPPVSAPTKSTTGFRRRGVRVITAADPQFPLPVRKHRQIVADPKYRRHILYQDPDAPIRRWVQVVDGPLPARKHVSIEGL